MFSHPKFHVGDLVRVVDGWDDDGYYTDARKNVIIENNSLGVIIDIHFMFSVEAEKDLIRVEQRAI
jgi:methionine aminopeptidase